MTVGTEIELARNADLVEVMRQYKTILDRIPEPADDDGTGMIIDILNAKTADDLLGEAELPSAQDIAERYPRKMFLITDLIRRDSDLDNGMPYYVIASLVDESTGETIRINTSAATPLAKIAKLYDFGALPARVAFTLSDKPTKAGYRPVNMTVSEHSVKDK